MDDTSIEQLPGAEIVLAGIRDLDARRDSPEAAAVAMAATRLRAAGLDVPPPLSREIPAHHLFDLLLARGPRQAHSTFNAITRRVASFASAAEHARAR